MRTTKRFTPKVIERFIREGRGEGTYEDYIGWHRVTRGDPASSGRSHILNWRNRLRDLLSDGELGEQLFATMLPDLDDSLEQYELTPEPSEHPLAAYGEGDMATLFPGTVALAKELGIKHPKLSQKGESIPWHFSTDLLLTFKSTTGRRHMLALAYKTNDWKSSPRIRELLRIEKEYWERRGVRWLLISPELSDFRVVLTLRRIACWALADEAPFELRQLLCHRRWHGNADNSEVPLHVVMHWWPSDALPSAWQGTAEHHQAASGQTRFRDACTCPPAANQ